MKYYFVKFHNRHPDVMAQYCYIVQAANRVELAERIRNVDGKMELSEAIEIKEIDMLSAHVIYALGISGIPLNP